MKLVIAIIQPDMLNQVREALVTAEITRITVSRCTGRGKAGDVEHIYRGQVVPPTLIPKVRIDVAVNDEFVKPCVDAIMEGARHGKGRIGDGKIFVVPLEQVYRIRTAEDGAEAV